MISNRPASRSVPIAMLCAGVVTAQYVVGKARRDALFLAEYGALALPYAYIGVALASAGFVWLEML